jgi:hypothetical protein
VQWIDVTWDIVFLCFRFRLFRTNDVVIIFVHVLCGMFVNATTEGMVCSRSWSGGTHPIMLSSSGNLAPDQPQVHSLCLAVPWFTHMVPTGGFGVHSCAKKRIAKIPWRVAKGAETGCDIWAACTCENPHRWNLGDR